MGPCIKNMREAVRYYRLASDAGLVNAQYNLGNCYTRSLAGDRSGIGWPVQPHRA